MSSLLSATQGFFTVLQSNTDDSTLLLWFTEFFIASRQLIYKILLNTLQLLPPMLAETVIVFLCRELGPLMARTVSFIQVRKFGIHYTDPFTLQPLWDDLNICISLIFKYIIIVCYHVYRALLKSSSFLLIAVFPLTIKIKIKINKNKNKNKIKYMLIHHATDYQVASWLAYIRKACESSL